MHVPVTHTRSNPVCSDRQPLYSASSMPWHRCRLAVSLTDRASAENQAFEVANGRCSLGQLCSFLLQGLEVGGLGGGLGGPGQLLLGQALGVARQKAKVPQEAVVHHVDAVFPVLELDHRPGSQQPGCNSNAPYHAGD